ncbi:MAG: hypothetical protein ACOCPQ_01245 [Desulfosudaceae bacterium]
MGEILNLGALNLAMGIGVRLETFEVPDRLEEMPGDAFNPPFFCRK